MSAATSVVVPNPRSDLLAFVESHSGQRVVRCYQCGKCTAGCPLAPAMDLTPRQVLRAVQLGLADEVLRSDAIRLCVACYTCAVRCPLEIEIPRVMEALVQYADQQGMGPRRGEVALFQQLFLKVVERGGRTYEVGLAGLYNLLSGHPFANLSALPDLLRKGKLPLRPRVAGAGEVQRIFARVAAHEARHSAPPASTSRGDPTER